MDRRYRELIATRHYESIGVDSRERCRSLFDDGLDLPRCADLGKQFKRHASGKGVQAFNVPPELKVTGVRRRL